jgi:hypothetical protein
MNHKRKRPKNARAGCLRCKPHKANGTPLKDRVLPNQLRRLQERPESLADGEPHTH